MADSSIREHLVKLLGWEDAHTSFESAVADLPADLRGTTPQRSALLSLAAGRASPDHSGGHSGFLPQSEVPRAEVAGRLLAVLWLTAEFRCLGQERPRLPPRSDGAAGLEQRSNDHTRSPDPAW